VWIDVEIVNPTRAPVELAYNEIPQLARVYVTYEAGGRTHFMPARPTVHWLEAPPANVRVIRIAPGASHRTRFALLDYFDIASGRAVTVWLSVRARGGQAHLGGGGAGVHVR
jgi:hypothetical protein